MTLPSIFHIAQRKLAKLLRNTSGNVALIFSLSAIPLTIAVGAGVDMAHLSRVQNKLSHTADAVALAAARSFDDIQNRETIARKFLEANLPTGYGFGVEVTALNINFDEENKRVTVRLVADIPMIVMGLFGIPKKTAEIKSRVTFHPKVTEPVSLGFVLDASGSMDQGNPKKIRILRRAALDLLLRLHTADPESVYIRTGLVSFSSHIKQSVNMHWGGYRTYRALQNLHAGGGTETARPVGRVAGWLMGDSEIREHEGQDVNSNAEVTVHRYMLFMTDGENDVGSASQNAAEDADTRTHCDNAKADGVEIFTVAFSAPPPGQALLQHCASSADHYFDADNEAAFLAAFDNIARHVESRLLRLVE